jgi:hypothetical protein
MASGPGGRRRPAAEEHEENARARDAAAVRPATAVERYYFAKDVPTFEHVPASFKLIRPA